MKHLEQKKTVVQAYSITQQCAQSNDISMFYVTAVDTFVGLSRWLYKKLDYQSLVNALQMGLITEDEYLEEQLKFLPEEQSISIEDISMRIFFIKRYSTIDFSLSDFEELFHVDESVIKKAVESSENVTRVIYSTDLKVTGKWHIQDYA
jgi:hypothetical protein